MAEVTLERIGLDRAHTVSNLFQLYVHDFTEFWETRRLELGEDGRFPPHPSLADYWTEPGRESFLIHADGALAGFVLLNGHSHSGDPVDCSVGEFFVARHHRRAGVGRAAALAVVVAKPGQWEVAIARKNTVALAFWRGVASAAAAGAVDERDRADATWNGAILRFRVGH